MKDKKYPPEFIKLLKSVKAKRPKAVIDHILEHGQVSTEELKDLYNYNHPPRAARDVRELGIPLKTLKVAASDGRTIGAYIFGDPSEVRATQLSGRTVFSSTLKKTLMSSSGPRCNIYSAEFAERDLQIDHRIPFEIGGDDSELSENPDDYQLLSGSANRFKSWSCENCPNWKDKNVSVCKSCYWAFPESYDHIATTQMRRMDLLWTENETVEYELIKSRADEVKEEPTEYVKRVLSDHLKTK